MTAGGDGNGVVSTIIPVFNRPALLIEAVDSVLAQTYQSFEIIIVDDGSTDATPEVAARYARQHPERVKCARLDRGREWRARNHGLGMARGEFIQFLDSDDLIAPEKFATQVHALRSHPECALSYCYAREYAMGDPPPSRPARRTGDTFERLFPALLGGRIWPYPSPLIRRSVIDAAGGGFLDRAAYPDWELEARIGALGVRVHHCRQFLAITRNTHAIERRRRPIRPPQTMKDSAEIHALILQHARAAGVPTAATAQYARRLFVVARQCASIGLEAEAVTTLTLAAGVAAPRHRRAIKFYESVSRLAGWQRVARVSERAASIGVMLSRPVTSSLARWRHRASVGLDEVTRRPVIEWPTHLFALWMNRPSRRRPA